MKKKTKVNKASSGSAILIFGLSLVTIYFKQNSADPFNTPKLSLILILCGLLIGPLIYSYYKLNVKKNSLEFITILFSTIFIISLTYALFNTDVLIRGFIGDTQRRNGFLHYLTMMVIFLFLARNINFEFAKKIIKTCIWLCLILGFYGLLQISGRDFVDWVNPYNSMISTMGNPNFASSMLAFFLSIAVISIYVLNLSLFYKFIALLSSAISVIAIIKSGSRQGLIVIAIVISLFISVSIMTKSKKYGILAVGINIILFIFGILGMLQIGPLQGFLYKDSVSVRGYYWRAGIEMFRHNVLTGVGLDSYLTYFSQYRESGYPKNYGFEISSSNAHNTVIQMFSTGGIFVGLSYLALLTYVLFCGFRLVHKVDKQYKGISTLLVTAWIGLESQSIISIDFIGLSLWTWVFAGMIVGLYGVVDSERKLIINERVLDNLNSKKLPLNYVSTNYIFPRIISGIFLVPIIIVVVLLNRVEEQTFISPALLNSNQKDIVASNSEKILNNPLADPYYKFKVGLNVIDAGYFEKGVGIIRKLSEEDPRQLDYLKLLVRVEMNQKNLDEAVKLRETIAKLDPWNAQNYFELALLYKSLGNDMQVQKIRDIILKINTSTAYSNQAKLELN